MTLLRKKDKTENPMEMEVTVRFLDDSDPKTFKIQKETTGQWLFDQVCEELNLLEKDYFGLRYVDPDRQRHWLDPLRGIQKQLKVSGPVVFSFRAKYYPENPNLLQEEITRYFLFLQVRRDLLRARLLAPPDIATQLAALIVQEEVGDYDPEDHPVGYLNEMKILPRHNPDINTSIHEAHVNCRGLVPAAAEQEFLRQASSLDTYGVDPHPVKDAQGKSLYFGITHKGLTTFSSTGSKLVQSINWSDVHKLNYDGKTFTIHLTEAASNNASSPLSPGSNSKKRATIAYKCPTTSATKYLWKCALEHQAFFRMAKALDVPKVHGGGFLRGSKFRYSGRCLEELLPEYARNKREDPDFVRSPSRVSLINAHKQPSLQSQPFQRRLEDKSRSPEPKLTAESEEASTSGVNGDLSSGVSPPRSLNPTDVYSSTPSEDPIPEAPEEIQRTEEPDAKCEPSTVEVKPVVEVAVDADVPPEKPEPIVDNKDPIKPMIDEVPIEVRRTFSEPLKGEDEETDSNNDKREVKTERHAGRSVILTILLALIVTLVALVVLLEMLPSDVLRSITPLASARQLYLPVKRQMLAIIS